MYLKKAIPDFPKYSVDTNGVCRNEETGKEIAFSISKRGYKSVRFCKCEGWGKEKIHTRFLVHRLMMTLFVGVHKDPKKCYVDHIDNNPRNNHISNLRWVTQSENVKRFFDQGRSKPPLAMKGMSGKLHVRSKPIAGYDKMGNEVIRFESISIAKQAKYYPEDGLKNGYSTSKGLVFKYL